MRKIKFRAWGKTLRDEVDLGTNAKPKMSEPFGLDAICQECGTFNGPSGHDQLPDTVIMQFTGLKDKNGKEIYEGDILRYGGVMNEVKYDERLAVYHDIFGLGFASLAAETEVVGSIYENSDMLV